MREFANLAIEIGNYQAPPGNPDPPPSPFDNPGFTYATGVPGTPGSFQISGGFTSPQTAAGFALFTIEDRADCAQSIVTWSANR